MSAAKRRVYGISFGIFLFVLWYATAFIVNKSFILPGPFDVLSALWKDRVEIFTVHLPSTMKVVAIGFIFSVIIGFAFAVLMDINKSFEKALYPLLTASQTIPTMCIAPVFVLWFGYSVLMRVVVVVLINFFSITVNVFDGFKSTNEGRTELMTTYGAGRFQVFFMLRLPSALPNFFTALKVAVPWSVVGAAVAEWLGANAGLGTYSRSQMMELNAAGLLAPLVVLTLTALILNAFLGLIEKKVVTWRGEI